MKKILSVAVVGALAISFSSAKFVYDAKTNTFTYMNENPIIATGSVATGSTTTGTVITGTVTTGIVMTGVATLSGSTDIAGLLKTLDTNTLATLSAFKSAYDLEYARLSTATTDASSKGLMGMVLCFTPNPKSSDQLKADLKMLYETSTKSLIEKSSMLAGQLSALEKQLQYGTINAATLGLLLVGPRADVITIGDNTKNGTKEFTVALSTITQSFQSAVAKVASGSLTASGGVAERYIQFTKLEQDFKDFSQKISLQGISISNLPQLEQVQQIFVRLAGIQYKSQLSQEIFAYIPTGLEKDPDILYLVDKAEKDYNDSVAKYSSSLLQDLTQKKGVTDVADSLAMLRAIYKPQNDILCNAFMENTYISELAPKIGTQMNTVLTSLNTAANRIALEKGILVKDGNQLQQGYTKAIISFADTTRVSSLKTLKGLVSDAVRVEGKTLLSKPKSVSISVAQQVAKFLAKKMQEYSDLGKLADFQSLITRAMEKIALLKTTAKNKKTLETMSSIEEGMKIFQ